MDWLVRRLLQRLLRRFCDAHLIGIIRKFARTDSSPSSKKCALQSGTGILGVRAWIWGSRKKPTYSNLVLPSCLQNSASIQPRTSPSKFVSRALHFTLPSPGFLLQSPEFVLLSDSVAGLERRRFTPTFGVSLSSLNRDQ